MAKGGQGGGKGRIKVGVCRFNEGNGTWRLQTVPAHVASKFVSTGKAVYPVGGVCPTDPPVEEDEGEVEEEVVV